MQWRMDRRTDANKLASFLDILSQRVMPGSPGGKWATSGEFGEFILCISKVLQPEQPCGSRSGSSDVENVFQVLYEAIPPLFAKWLKIDEKIAIPLLPCFAGTLLN